MVGTGMIFVVCEHRVPVVQGSLGFRARGPRSAVIFGESDVHLPQGKKVRGYQRI
jgi:hypothetical protein